MINPIKYATKKMVESKGNGYLLSEYTTMIEEIQKDAYNQALKDASKNAEVCFYKNEELISNKTLYDDDYKYVNFDSLPSFTVNKESILKLKIK